MYHWVQSELCDLNSLNALVERRLAYEDQCIDLHAQITSLRQNLSEATTEPYLLTLIKNQSDSDQMTQTLAQTEP